MKEVELGKQLHSLLRLPAAIGNQQIIGIYATCCVCGKKILTNELSISRLVADSKNPESFIRKANSLVYRRSTLHEEKCKWGIPTVKVRTRELLTVPQARSRREWELRNQMLQLLKNS
jgi:hypothetical protein